MAGSGRAGQGFQYVGANTMDYDSNEQMLESYDMFLNPGKLKANLMLASLYLTMYEMMKSSIMDHVRGLFIGCGDERREARYALEVLPLCAKDPFRASCLWIHNSRGFTADDLAEIQTLRERRNRVAHQMPMVISDVRLSVDITWLNRIRVVAAKFDRWWLRNFDFDDAALDEVPDEEIHSGNMIFMDLIIRTVDGRDEELESIYQSYRNTVLKGNCPPSPPN